MLLQLFDGLLALSVLVRLLVIGFTNVEQHVRVSLTHGIACTPNSYEATPAGPAGEERAPPERGA